MTDTSVKIRSKGCASTGITDELAAKMYNTKGSRHMAIVEFKVARTSEDADGDRAVDLTIEEIEPVVDGDLNGRLDEHVRTIQQALYRNRALAEGQSELDFENDEPEPTVSDVIAAGQALIETDDDGEVTGVWDGQTDQAEEDIEQDDDGPDPNDPAYEPHAYVDTTDATCATCGQPAGSALHNGELSVADEDATRHLATVPDPFTTQEA